MGTKGTIIKHFNIPKLEIWHHFTHSARAMGAPIQWSADVTEWLHKTQVKITFHKTNHCNFEEQCARSLDRLERVYLFDLLCSFAWGTSLATFICPSARILDNKIVTSRHPTQNHFLKGFLSSTSLAAFHLNKVSNITSLSIDQAADLYVLPDLWPALGDFTSKLSYQQHRGHRIATGRPDVGFDDICVWYRFKIQPRSLHNKQMVTPAQTVQAHPPSQC
jgi:hypothetical protein